ncbi:helix-turn-helix domain-containing protein [Micromonospora sp. MED01]|uniref:helix-turn-helix domain-containing protein n=1 Tax=Micromonospora alfalfae TaxID=2911212 RepID=UPI001EE7F6D1|nr:helix-turn-helix domain-containing protein [Micromonospora alfalfae]MCG5466748.1 helix-turn-helix domain-containing protein [Micromonospora alfalfae]
MGQNEEPPGGPGSALISQRLQSLYKNHRPNRPYNDTEVAEALKAKGYGTSGETLRRLRTGEHANPKASTLTALAEFFGVGAGYFLDPEPVSAKVQVMTRSIEQLSDGAKEGIDAIIQSTLRMEQAAREAAQLAAEQARRDAH